MSRRLYRAEHELFENTVERFLKASVEPYMSRWEEQNGFDSCMFRDAAQAGILCPTIPEEYGGGGGDILYSAVLLEKCSSRSNIGLSLAMHSDIVANYFLRYASLELKSRYLPRMAAGQCIGALGMTEPGTGSDIKAIKTRAVSDGDDYIINGSKIFISNGSVCDVVIVVASTDPAAQAKGITLIAVDSSTPGFSKGTPLKKMGLKSQDTSELFFDNVRVPKTQRIGDENQGFRYLMQELPWERLQIAISAIGAAQACYDQTLEYVRQRHAFGQAISEFQNTRFKLAELKTELKVATVFVDHCLEQLQEGTLDAQTASMAKLWTTEMQSRVVDAGVQLHGGYGFMWESAVARSYVDARAQRIYGGTNEIMKELIARDL